LEKVLVISLGCPKNEAISRTIRAKFLSQGAELVSEPQEASTIVVNTCSFVDEAKDESIEVLLEAAKLKENGCCKKLIATGCLTARYKSDLEGLLPEVDLVVENVDKLKDKSFLAKAHDSRPWAYLQIADGCNQSCSFCAIPFIKGRQRSFPVEELVDEAKALVSSGVKELILVAQDTGAYGVDLYGKPMLTGLIERLSNLNNLFWLRLMYLQPAWVNDLLISCLKENQKVCKYLDIPVQHASSKILLSMGRKNRAQDYLDLIETIRSRLPEVSLRSSVIVGYPGETKADFDELSNFIREAKFDYLGIFGFSPQAGTPAYNLRPRISKKVIEDRVNQLRQLADLVSWQNQSRRLGQEKEVIIEAKDYYENYAGHREQVCNTRFSAGGKCSTSENFCPKITHPQPRLEASDTWIGRFQGQAPEVDGNVIVRGSNLKVGKICRVRLDNYQGYDFLGRLVEPG
jgi:ribosomal protein S12 methylthiotransferase